MTAELRAGSEGEALLLDINHPFSPASLFQFGSRQALVKTTSGYAIRQLNGTDSPLSDTRAEQELTALEEGQIKILRVNPENGRNEFDGSGSQPVIPTGHTVLTFQSQNATMYDLMQGLVGAGRRRLVDHELPDNRTLSIRALLGEESLEVARAITVSPRDVSRLSSSVVARWMREFDLHLLFDRIDSPFFNSGDPRLPSDALDMEHFDNSATQTMLQFSLVPIADRLVRVNFVLESQGKREESERILDFYLRMGRVTLEELSESQVRLDSSMDSLLSDLWRPRRRRRRGPRT